MPDATDCRTAASSRRWVLRRRHSPMIGAHRSTPARLDTRLCSVSAGGVDFCGRFRIGAPVPRLAHWRRSPLWVATGPLGLLGPAVATRAPASSSPGSRSWCARTEAMRSRVAPRPCGNHARSVLHRSSAPDDLAVNNSAPPAAHRCRGVDRPDRTWLTAMFAGLVVSGRAGLMSRRSSDLVTTPRRCRTANSHDRQYADQRRGVTVKRSGVVSRWSDQVVRGRSEPPRTSCRAEVRL